MSLLAISLAREVRQGKVGGLGFTPRGMIAWLFTPHGMIAWLCLGSAVERPWVGNFFCMNGLALTSVYGNELFFTVWMHGRQLRAESLLMVLCLRHP